MGKGWASYERVQTDFPEVTVEKNIKFVDEGSIITSEGISTGIHMAFHIVKRLLGAEITETAAKRMEYDINISLLP